TGPDPGRADPRRRTRRDGREDGRRLLHARGTASARGAAEGQGAQPHRVSADRDTRERTASISEIADFWPSRARSGSCGRMGRFALVTIALAGCLDNPTVEIDQSSLDMPQGTAQAVTVSVDGEPVDSLFSVVWTIDDPTIVSVTPEYDGKRLRITAATPGATIVHVNSHGQTHDIPVRVGPPAIVYMWI